MTSSSDPTRVRVPDGSEKLIQEGAKSYVQATIAMNQFKEIVLDVCEEVAKSRLEDINMIMGTDFSEDDPTPPWPRKGKSLNPQDPWVCVLFCAKPAVEINIGLYWKSLDGRFQLHAVTAFQFWDKALFQKARQKVDENKDLKFGSFPYGDQDRFMACRKTRCQRNKRRRFPRSFKLSSMGSLKVGRRWVD